ncbi:uncharacterized protein KZ484_019920 [Pholidichthys leucotaenia]
MELTDVREQYLYQKQDQENLQPPQEVHPEHLSISGELEQLCPVALKIKEEPEELCQEPLDIKVVQVEFHQETADIEDYYFRENQEELCTSLCGQQFLLKQENHTILIVKPEREEVCSEDEPRHQYDGTWNPELGFHSKEAPHRHVLTEQIHSDQQLFNQQRSSGLDQEEPHLPQVKEDDEERGSSGDNEQVLLNQDTDGVMLTEEGDRSGNGFQDSCHLKGVDSDGQSTAGFLFSRCSY